MDTFYLIVLGVATLVLILMLAFLGWNMSNAKKGSRYPVITTTCPDNWTPNATKVPGSIVCNRPSGYNKGEDAKTGISKPYNVPLSKFMTDSIVGDNPNGAYLNFSSDQWGKYNNKNATCEKRDWANAYGIRWDSVETANYCD